MVRLRKSGSSFGSSTIAPGVEGSTSTTRPLLRVGEADNPVASVLSAPCLLPTHVQILIEIVARIMGKAAHARHGPPRISSFDEG